MKLAESTLKKAMKFNLTDLILMLSRLLRTHYSSIVGSQKKLIQYSEIIEKYSRIFEAEVTAEHCHANLSFYYVNTRTLRTEAISLADEYVARLEPYFMKIDSFRFHFLYYNTIITGYQLKNNHELVIDKCNEGLRFFEGREENTPGAFLFNLNLAKIPAYIQL